MKSKNLKNDKGQAIFEFIVFLPFFLMLFAFFGSVANSINGSINQLKSSRSYFYHLSRGNSQIFNRQELSAMASSGVRRVSISIIGWKHKTSSKVPVAPCYKVFHFGENNETCEEKPEEERSNYIRVFTAYGICGTSYSLLPSGNFQPNYGDSTAACGQFQ